MRIKAIEARIARLEASQRFSALGRLSDADLDRQIVLGLNDMASDWPSFGAMVSNLRESPMPADKDHRDVVRHVDEVARHSRLRDWIAPASRTRPTRQSSLSAKALAGVCVDDIITKDKARRF